MKELIASDGLLYGVAMLPILLNMSMLLLRAFRGPTVFDRILAVSSFGSKTVILIAVVSFLIGRPDFIDLALVYVLMNFISTLAVMRFTTFDDPELTSEIKQRRARWT